MDRNSEKWSQKCYHSLPFAEKVSVPRSFEQFRSLNWGDKEALRIIQSHHVIKHAVFKQSKGFLTACRNTAAYCIFLPFGTRDSGSKFRRYQVFIRYNWTSASMTKAGKQAVETKAKCFKAWRLFLLSSLFLSNMHYWPSVRWSMWLDIWANFFFFFLSFC